jgi:hypothetical protein
MSKRTDLAYGRRGGRFVPDGYAPTDARRSPRCDVCGRPALLGQPLGRHHVCAASIVATTCTCRDGCTDEFVGDGPTPCAPDCRPCSLTRGKRHREVFR